MGFPLRLLSLNIRFGTASDGPDHWRYRSAGVLNLLTRLSPDVVGLQEVLHFQLGQIEAALDGYGAIGVGREDGAAEGEYCPILYATNRLQLADFGTFWLSDTPDVPGSNHWGDSNVRICTWALFRPRIGGEDFYCFNTHLAVSSQLARENGVELILSRVDQKRGATVIMGDFNAGESNKAVEMMRKGGFRDSFRVISPEGEAGTFNGFQESFLDEKIDYIWASEDWSVTDARILREKVNGRWVSDHAAVTATLA